MDIRPIVNILAVCGSAMFAGVMMAIGLILGRYWKSLWPDVFLDWFSQNGKFIEPAIPLVVIPTVIGLVGSLWLSWSEATARSLWLASLGCIAAVLVLTIAYFVPSNAQFAAKSISPDQVPAKLDTWLLLHNARIALAAFASVLGMLAVR